MQHWTYDHAAHDLAMLERRRTPRENRAIWDRLYAAAREAHPELFTEDERIAQ